MKLRALGTGSPVCKHPLVTSSFLVQSDSTNIVIGCGPNIPAKLETMGIKAGDVDMWIITSARLDQIGGLIEVAKTHSRKSLPYLMAPYTVLSHVTATYRLLTGRDISKDFETKSSLRVSVGEEHFDETITLVSNYPTYTDAPSYSVVFEKARIFISGDTGVNEEFIHRYGMPAELILHACTISDTPTGSYPHVSELQSLPVYIQKKIWLYGYENTYIDYEDPIPMLFVPQGTWVFDSSRKDTHLEKERFIRENTKRQLGNKAVSHLSS